MTGPSIIAFRRRRPLEERSYRDFRNNSGSLAMLTTMRRQVAANEVIE